MSTLASTVRGDGMPLDLTPVDQLVERMSAQLGEMEARGERARVFLFAYRLQTLEMRRNLVEGRFADPTWVIGMICRFAELYFSAEVGHRRGDPVGCPAPWRAFFRVADDGRVTDAELLLLGMNAHIVHDLALAMWDQMERAGDFAAMGQGGPLSSILGIRRFDHDMVNEVLEEAIDPMQDALAAAFFRWLRVVDVAMLRFDEWIAHRLLRAARADVWVHATGLGCARNPTEAAAVRRHLVTESMENVRRIDAVNFLPSARLRALARRLRPDYVALAERA